MTGATGRVGPHAVAHLRDAGYRTVGASRSGGSDADVDLRGDLTDAGDAYGVLARAAPDAVVHLGTLSNPRETPGHVTFESSVSTTYNVLEAAESLGIDRVVAASSLAALGAGFQPEPPRVEYLPVDEDHPLTPHDPYGLGKQVGEVAAEGVARRPGGPSVASLRFPLVVDDEEARETFATGDRSLAGIRASGYLGKSRNTLFAYVHVDDAVTAVERALVADIDGHEAVWVTAADTTTDADSRQVAADCYPDATVREPLWGSDSLVSTAKAEQLLEWTPTRSFREFRDG